MSEKTLDLTQAIIADLRRSKGSADNRTVSDDLRDFGNAFEIDGRRVDPSRVTVHASGHYEVAVPKDGRTDLHKDAARLRMLATLSNNHLYLTRNAENAPCHQTAAKWIEDSPEDFDDVPADELQRMKDTNTIWCLHVYPHTPIGFWRIYGATLEYVLDAAIEALAEQPSLSGGDHA